MSRQLWPPCSAAVRTAETQSASKGVAGNCQKSTMSTVQPAASAISVNSARSRSFIAASVSSSGCRRSTVKKTLPGIVLREFGLDSTKPTVAQA